LTFWLSNPHDLRFSSLFLLVEEISTTHNPDCKAR
jgi:hypothetical protein